VRTKNVGKKIVGQMCENRFLYANGYRDQKMGGKNARKNFFTYTRIVQAKNVGKKSSIKGGKCFLYIHEYRDQKMGGKKCANQFFQKHMISANKKWEKNRPKKVRKTFFTSTRIS